MSTLNDAKRVTARRHYDGFDLMPIAGRWRKGRSSRRIEDVDPYRGDTCQ